MADAFRVADAIVGAPERPQPSERADLLAEALAQRPSALFCDIDGTISPIVDAPEKASVLPRARAALRALLPHVDVLCFLTGRAADDAWRMVGVDGALYIGNHGAEAWRNGELLRPAGIERWHVRLARAAAVLRLALANVPGLVFEDKGIGFAVHFRRDRAQGPGVREAAERVARRRGLQVVARTDHVEVRAPVPGDKGTALRELAERHALAGLAVIGDDPVDSPAFEAARAYASASGARAAIVTVGTLRPVGDVHALSPAEVAELLAATARILGGRQR